MRKFRQLSLLYALLTIGIVSCNNNDTGSMKNSIVLKVNKKNYLKSFLKKFKILSLPLTIQVSTEAPKGFPKAQREYTDTAFIEVVDGSNNSSICYGLLPDTSQYFMIIWEYPANFYVPIISIYTKDGDKVFEQVISVGDCAGKEMVANSGICTSCINKVLIREDYSIYASDAIITNKCDTQGNVINGTSESQLIYVNGKITKDGKIEFGNQQKVVW